MIKREVLFLPSDRGSGTHQSLYQTRGPAIQKHEGHDPIDPGSKVGLSGMVSDRQNYSQIFKLMGFFTEEQCTSLR